MVLNKDPEGEAGLDLILLALQPKERVQQRDSLPESARPRPQKPPCFLTSCPDHVLSFLISAYPAHPHPLKSVMDTNSLRNGTDEPVCRAEIVMQMRGGADL